MASWYRIFSSSRWFGLESGPEGGEGEGKRGPDCSGLAGKQFVGSIGEKGGRREDYFEDKMEAMVNVSAGDS